MGKDAKEDPEKKGETRRRMAKLRMDVENKRTADHVPSLQVPGDLACVVLLSTQCVVWILNIS